MKSEKGYTGVDIAISIVVITIFISLITVITYRFNSSTKEIELKSEALDIAINKIEEIKSKGIEQVNEEGRELNGHQGFYQKVEVTDATDIINFEDNQLRKDNLVKKAIVTISYKFKNKEEKIELSTILVKEF